MASILKVDTIQDQDGNNIINESGDTITIGASGDTITIPSGASLAGTLTTAAQPNITSVGTLTSFASTGIDDNATSTAITISSDERVTVDAADEKAFVVHHTDGSTVRIGMNNDSTNSNELAFVSSDFAVKPGGTERMRLNSAGRLLLNTTSFQGGGTIGFQINATSNSSGAYAQLIKNNSGTEIFQMRCNGGLANYSSSNVNLSDEREKKNIEDMQSSWEDVKNWSLRKYHYNSDEDTDDKRYGVVAQQIEQITPELVTVFNKSPEILWQEGEELPEGVSVGDVKTAAVERKGVHEQQMFWTAIKALQEAMERIETLEAKVTALENA